MDVHPSRRRIGALACLGFLVAGPVACKGPLDDEPQARHRPFVTDDQPEAEVIAEPDEEIDEAPGVDGVDDEPPPGMVVAEPEPAPEPAAERAAAPARPDRPAWWLEQPRVGEGAFAATVQADGQTVKEARASAVDAAMETLAAHYGGPREDARIEKTLIVSPSPGVYRAFVYVAVDDRASATASAGDRP